MNLSTSAQCLDLQPFLASGGLAGNMADVPSIARLEPYWEFQSRLVRLNGLHNAEDPVHRVLMGEDATFAIRGQMSPEPAPETMLGQAVHARRALVAVHNHYPPDSAAWEQAAYLLRGLCGLRPFAAGNERTAWDFVAGHLDHHAVTLDATDREVDDLLNWLDVGIQRNHPQGFARYNLRDEDLLWSELCAWFRHHAAGIAHHHLAAAYALA